MAKNEFFVNSAESSRLIYDFVLKSMKETGVGMPFFPGGLFYAAWFPQPKFYRLHGRPVRRRCARPVSFRMRMHMHSPLRRCAREKHFLLCRILRGGARAAHLVLCAHFLAEGRSPERGKPEVSFRNRFFGSFRLLKSCFRQRKDYAFFRCPSCREIVRVPRGKGKIRITCPRCGYAFEKKT